MTRRLTHAGTTICLVCCVACGTPSPDPDPQRQWYQALVVIDPVADAEIPFFFELPANCDRETATIANGEELLPVECTRADDRVTLEFPVYGNSILASVQNDGRLTGEWRHDLPENIELPARFEASPVQGLDASLRFQAQPGATEMPQDVSGIWRMEIDGYGPARLAIEQDASGVVTASVEVPAEYGDLRYLAGNVHGDHLALSTFDGGHALLVRGDLDADRVLRGELFKSGDEPGAFVAERSEDFEVMDPLQTVRVTSAARRLTFEPLDDARYADKAIILEIFATWCPNCNDLAPRLVDLYERYEDDGLEVLGIAYELSGDEAYNDARLAAYRETHGIDWEFVRPGALPDDLFDGPAQLSPIEGVPVTIFLNRDRTVHAIYAGFWGPATGEAFEEAKATFERLTAEILESE